MKGTDIKSGSVVIGSSRLITPGLVTVLASLGYDEVKVQSLPSVAVITTGDEIIPVDAPVNEVQIRNSNRHLLQALLKKWEIKPAVNMHVKDDASILAQAVNRCRNHDIIILSGAVSAGDADFVPELLLQAGADKIFHTVAIRPGKPVWFGKFKNGPVVFALPGNPFSTFVTFKLFIEEFLLACFGLRQTQYLQLPFSGSRIKKTQLDEFFPAAVSGNPASAVPVTFNTSGDITAVMNADALVWHPYDVMEIKKGDVVSCLML